MDALENGRRAWLWGIIAARYCVFALLPLASACTTDRPVHIRTPADIRRPDRAAIVFFIDGFGEKQFDEALADGRLPNVTEHILNRGVRVEKAVACIPSITYGNAASFITGCFPGHHGIIANRWFEPSTGRFRDYCLARTYQLADKDYAASPTIYDVLRGRVSVNIQMALRRGVTHSIDNWATGGLNWFFENHGGVDCLVAQQFELIGERTSWWRQWPDFIMAYFPSPDHLAHEFGAGSPQYRRTIANIDRQIGRICDALQEIGMYDRTYFCLVSDHGMVDIRDENRLDLSALVARGAGKRVWSNRLTEPDGDGRLPRGYDYVVAVNGSRWAAVYPTAETMNDAASDAAGLRKTLARLEADVPSQNAESSNLDPCDGLPGWLVQAVAHPGVELAAVCFKPGCVHVFNKAGYALVLRMNEQRVRHLVYQRPAGAVFEHDRIAETLNQEEASDSRAWLRLTVDDRYPDFVPQIAALFDSERAGNIVLFAAEGWDFSTNEPAGAHGSVLAGDMRVPMLFAGPGLPNVGNGKATPREERITVARNCDLMPTLLHLLGAEPVLPDGWHIDMDGVDLLRSEPRGEVSVAEEM